MEEHRHDGSNLHKPLVIKDRVVAGDSKLAGVTMLGVPVAIVLGQGTARAGAEGGPVSRRSRRAQLGKGPADTA